jgi:hypothetical protein
VVYLGSIRRRVTGLALVALRSFLGTFLIVSVAGAFLADASGYFLRHHPPYAMPPCPTDTSPGYRDGLNSSASVGTFLAIDSP